MKETTTSRLPRRAALLAVFVALSSLAHAHGGPAAASAASNDAVDRIETKTVRFLEERIARDPLDFYATNRLAEVYLRRFHRSGIHGDLDRARELAAASLKRFPARLNPAALTVLARVELASHDFAVAAQLARELDELAPGGLIAGMILGDALLESGDYSGADAAYQALARRSDRRPATIVSLETRIAHLAWLRGDTGSAARHMQSALDAANELPPGNEDRVAWCHWRIGTMAFARGELAEAERSQRHALTVNPGFVRAVAALAQIRSVSGDLAAAIELYEKAITLSPHIRFVAELGDLYALNGQKERALLLYARAERIGFDLDSDHNQNTGHHHHGKAVPEGTDDVRNWPSHYGRELALFYADRDLKPRLALQIARREYTLRQDIYTADALAWSALKAGDLELARTAIQNALRLGAPDPGIYYHAGSIAYASGDYLLARQYLGRTLLLNPDFDTRHGPRARQLMKELDSTARAGCGSSIRTGPIAPGTGAIPCKHELFSF